MRWDETNNALMLHYLMTFESLLNCVKLRLFFETDVSNMLQGFMMWKLHHQNSIQLSSLMAIWMVSIPLTNWLKLDYQRLSNPLTTQVLSLTPCTSSTNDSRTIKWQIAQQSGGNPLAGSCLLACPLRPLWSWLSPWISFKVVNKLHCPHQAMQS